MFSVRSQLAPLAVIVLTFNTWHRSETTRGTIVLHAFKCWLEPFDPEYIASWCTIKVTDISLAQSDIDRKDYNTDHSALIHFSIAHNLPSVPSLFWVYYDFLD